MLSPDGRYLAVAARKLELWNAADLSTSATLWSPDQGAPDPIPDSWPTDALSLQYSGAVAISPDGATIADGLYGGRVRLWDPRTGRRIAEFSEGMGRGKVNGLAFTADGSRLAASFSAPIEGAPKGAVIVWDVAGQKPVFDSEVSTGAVAFRHDGLLCASTVNGVVFLGSSGAEVGKALAATPNVMAMNKEGTRLALRTRHDDNVVQLWDVDQLKVLRDFRAADSVYALAFDATSSKIAVGNESGSVEVWSAA